MLRHPNKFVLHRKAITTTGYYCKSMSVCFGLWPPDHYIVSVIGGGLVASSSLQRCVYFALNLIDTKLLSAVLFTMKLVYKTRVCLKYRPKTFLNWSTFSEEKKTWHRPFITLKLMGIVKKIIENQIVWVIISYLFSIFYFYMIKVNHINFVLKDETGYDYTFVG